MAFQSIKKGLPDSCECMESSLLDDLVDNVVNGKQPSLPRGYLSFVKRTVSRLFPKGWDTGYEGFCRRFSPPLKGTLQSGRSSGGCLGALKDGTGLPFCRDPDRVTHKPPVDNSDYLEVSLFGRSFSRPLRRLVGALQVVQSAGKPRPLTTFSADGAYLKPLHKTIYGHLSKQRWLSRGEVTPSSLHKAGFRRDLGSLVSGDYSSATDNLSIEVMECALSAMLDNAAVVPPNIREFALSACRPFLFRSKTEWADSLLFEECGSSVGELSKGQMMGSYLSFPLLCLQNYLAFRWSTRGAGHLPVIVNGDDILFQSSREVAADWMGTVGSLGLVVERTKTSIDDEYGTLNSTLLGWGSEGRLVVVPTLRFGMLRPSDYPSNLGDSFADFLRGSVEPRERWFAGRTFFDFHLGELRASSWSLPSLGFRGSLAHRLARVYGLLSGDRLEGSPPRAPCSHSVCLPLDLVSEVPNELVDSELRELNACEVASWKWAHGWKPSSMQSEAIAYAIDATRWTDDSDVVCSLIDAFSLTDRQFSWRFSGGGRLSGGGRVSRKGLLKPFLMDRPRRDVVLVHFNIVSECLLRTDWFRGALPSYEEACRDGGRGAS